MIKIVFARPSGKRGEIPHQLRGVPGNRGDSLAIVKHPVDSASTFQALLLRDYSFLNALKALLPISIAINLMPIINHHEWSDLKLVKNAIFYPDIVPLLQTDVAQLIEFKLI